MRDNKNFAFLSLGFLFFLNILAWIAIYDLKDTGLLKVIFFDVGQGDAIFIETPKGQQILIDSGPDSTILEKLGENLPFWNRSIDLIILTHPDADHLNGLIEVLKRYKVENILWTGVRKNTAQYREWQKLIEKEGAKIFIARFGQKISWSKIHPQEYIDILYPFENLTGQEFKNINDTSIVAHLFFGKVSFLFTGDIHKSVEKKLIENDIYLNSDILKVAHQGSKTSTSEEFLEEVSPEIAVIQVGENKYGHPAQEVLARLEKYDIKILRTDQQGDLQFLSNGNLWRFIPKKKKP